MREDKEELRINAKRYPNQYIPVCLLVEVFKKAVLDGLKTTEKALSRCFTTYIL